MSETRDTMSNPTEIGWPRDVRHVAHVTFDRFNGFLGLPSEFEPDVPRKAPSASATVFGVSTESMQLAYDSRGNCVPVILLLMQSRLYAQRGLEVEGIFRITADNTEEESVREQLNRGIIPDGINVHCLAGLIKAWFRELPAGILDSLPPQQVMQCESEADYVEVVRLLPPTQASLLNWTINLMADVVQHEHLNKMNARNIALVFAPNMSQMADPLTALMYAVQVMNLLKMLIDRTIRQRGDSVAEDPASDESGHQSPEESCDEYSKEEEGEQESDREKDSAEEEEDDDDDDEDDEESFGNDDYKDDYETVQTPVSGSPGVFDTVAKENAGDPLNGDETGLAVDKHESLVNPAEADEDGRRSGVGADSTKRKIGESSSNPIPTNDAPRRILLQPPELPVAAAHLRAGLKKGISNMSRISSRADRSEAWR